MTVAHLRRPSVRVRASFLDSVQEFRAEGISDRNRAELEDQRGQKLRLWIET